MSWAPNGDLWSISLSFDQTTTRNAVLAARMAHGSSSWSEPFHEVAARVRGIGGERLLVVGGAFSLGETNRSQLSAFDNAAAFHQRVWLARTTNGAAATPTWNAREIFDPGTKNGTISNQIAVLPDGTLVDGFYLFQTKAHPANFVAVIRSTNKGVTWSKKAIIVSPDAAIGETDPEPIHGRPFITGNPACTIVRSDGVIVDLAVDYSTGPHHGRLYIVWQDHQDNPNGDDLIMLSHSDDGGLTWSTPVKVNQTPTNNLHRPSIRAGGPRELERHRRGHLLRLPQRHLGRRHADDRRLDRQLHQRRGHLDRGSPRGSVRHAPGAIRPRLLRRRLPGLDSQGSVFRPLFTLANPDSDTMFPNPNPTDEFISSAS